MRPPTTKWKLPKSFPDLSAAKVIALDTETKDPQLLNKGPGVKRDGKIVGISVGTDDGYRRYFPFDHAEGNQLEKETVLRWAAEQLTRPNQPKIGANLLYDLDYLAENGIQVAGPFYDVQVAEPLLDENQYQYNLDKLSLQYLDEGKEETVLEEACRQAGYRGDPRKHIWKLPADVVGEYAEADADRPLRIFEQQKKALESQKLWDLFLLESDLIPVLLKMRRTGVRVDVGKTEEIADQFEKDIDTDLKRIKDICGLDIDIWAAASIAQAFDKLNLKYPLTAKTKAPSFTKPWLSTHSHPLAQAIVEARTKDKFLGTFLRGQILDLEIDGRLYTQFHQLKGDQYGTVTGRFSSSNPNLQFIPLRDPILGPLCRSLFLPELGHYWGRADYSQIEIRILAHYAMGMGSDSLRQAYINDPNIDYHTWCANEAGIDRKKAKTINFGLIYGMGKAKLARELNCSEREAQQFLNIYRRKLPFLQKTLMTAMDVAQGRGYVRTILGRRRRFPYWEPRDWGLARMEGTSSKDKDTVLRIIEEHKAHCRANKMPMPSNGIRRSGTYKAFNAVDQGSAADLMKKAMVDINKAGIYDVLPPHLTVHDELDNSVPKTKEGEEAFKEMTHLMEKAIPFKVPILVDSSLSDNWGTA